MSPAPSRLPATYNTFLTLLTTQLQNQDPLDPLDTNQFTQQLVDFASVEQQVNMNSNLQTLISLQQTNEATSAMQYLGSNVTVSGSGGTLSAKFSGHVVAEFALARDRQRDNNQFDRSDGLYRNRGAEQRKPDL